MYLKHSSIYVAAVFSMCFLLILSTEAQLNFSTGWGKRNNNLPSRSGDRSCGQGPNLERLLNLYNLIQFTQNRLKHREKWLKKFGYLKNEVYEKIELAGLIRRIEAQWLLDCRKSSQ